MAQVDADKSSKPAKRKRKKLITLGVVAAVLVVGIAGAWIWHEQPSFCGTMCHDSMGAYVEGYDSGDASKGITLHAKADVKCLNCHEAKLTDQVSEAMTSIAGNYEMTSDGMLAENFEFASEEFCARSGCHDMSEVVESTWGFAENDAEYNPHSSHQDLALECGDCHKIHGTNTLVCNKCHNLNEPEGWE